MIKSKKDYREKLKDPRWIKLSKAVKARDKYTCQACLKKAKVLNAHHQHYFGYKDPWDYNMRDLITLCPPCHQMEHEDIFGGRSDIITICNQLGFTDLDFNRLAGCFILDHGWGKDKENFDILGYLLNNKSAWEKARADYKANKK